MIFIVILIVLTYCYYIFSTVHWNIFHCPLENGRELRTGLYLKCQIYLSLHSTRRLNANGQGTSWQRFFNLLDPPPLLERAGMIGLAVPVDSTGTIPPRPLSLLIHKTPQINGINDVVNSRLQRWVILKSIETHN